MLKSKREIIKSLTPDAILLPLTKEATNSVAQCQKGIIQITQFPFKIGRELRVGENERGFFIKLRFKKSEVNANNDIYLIDNNRNTQIAKEHFQIEKTNNFFLLKDRGSKTGTTINDITYGGSEKDIEQVLNDGDIIKVGSSDSEFKFQFVVLKEV